MVQPSHIWYNHDLRRWRREWTCRPRAPEIAPWAPVEGRRTRHAKHAWWRQDPVVRAVSRGCEMRESGLHPDWFFQATSGRGLRLLLCMSFSVFSSYEKLNCFRFSYVTACKIPTIDILHSICILYSRLVRHNWSDDKCVLLLSNIAAAMRASTSKNSRLLIRKSVWDWPSIILTHFKFRRPHHPIRNLFEPNGTSRNWVCPTTAAL